MRKVKEKYEVLLPNNIAFKGCVKFYVQNQKHIQHSDAFKNTLFFTVQSLILTFLNYFKAAVVIHSNSVWHLK
jgi:hypothetical protein